MHRRVDEVALPMKSPAHAIFFLILALLLTLPLLSGGALGADEDESEHEYHNNEWTFLIISFVMTYGAMAIVTSLFTFKFGQKKAKIISIPVMLSGLIIWGIWIYFKFIMKAEYPDDTIFNIIHWSAAPILKPLLAVIGVILGAGLALFIFLTLVVRS
jgi:hypothetical protein